MQKQPKILIADDTHPIRHMIKIMLMNAGFTDLDEAENGLKVLEKLKKDCFSLVICDWDMPRMDGLEVLRNMRADESLAKIPFVLLTGAAEADKVAIAIKAGVDDYITKPIKPDNLAKRVKGLLNNRT